MSVEKGEHERAPPVWVSWPASLRATLRAPPSKWAIEAFFPAGERSEPRSRTARRAPADRSPRRIATWAASGVAVPLAFFGTFFRFERKYCPLGAAAPPSAPESARQSPRAAAGGMRQRAHQRSFRSPFGNLQAPKLVKTHKAAAPPSAPESARQTRPEKGFAPAGAPKFFPLALWKPSSTESRRETHKTASPNSRRSRRAKPLTDFFTAKLAYTAACRGLSARPLHPFGPSQFVATKGLRLRSHGLFPRGKPLAHRSPRWKNSFPPSPFPQRRSFPPEDHRPHRRYRLRQNHAGKYAP